MKVSIVFSILILALAAGLVLRDKQNFASSQERNAKLVSQAAALGISINSSSQVDSVRVTKLARESQQSADQSAGTELIGMIKKVAAAEKSGANVEAEFPKFMAQLASLNASSVEMLVAEVLDMNEIDAEMRTTILAVSMLKLANESPSATLRLLPKLFGVLPDKDQERSLRAGLLTTALNNWAKSDPMAVAEWMRQNGATFPEPITESTKCGILSGAVVQDPALAFKLIGELGIKDSGLAVTTIANASKTAEERTATLVALRDHLATFTDETTRREISIAVVRQLAFGSLKDGFDATNQWLTEANLSPEESDAFLSTLVYSNVKGDAPKWIDWLANSLPVEPAAESISILIHDWTLADYQATGKWLDAAPNGSAKNAAIQMYAATVSKYEPEAATQWAMTLPAGKDREWTLGQIYQNWPEGDTAAKEAFAKEHKIPAR